MKTTKFLTSAAKGYVIFSILCLVYVGLIGIISPQQVMDMVQISLTNTDAISSIRGVYGGVGITISCFLIYLLFKMYQWALGFLVLFWGSYALSRIITIFVEGGLGDFGSNWLLIESSLFLIGFFLLISKNLPKKINQNESAVVE